MITHSPAKRDGSAPLADPGPRRRRPWVVWRDADEGGSVSGKGKAGLAAGLAALVVLVGVALYAIWHTRGTPASAATDFLAAWEKQDHAAMDEAVTEPSEAMWPAYEQLREGLGVSAVKTTLGKVAETGDGATAAFTATLTLSGGAAWTYQGSLPLTVHDRHWKVSWRPAALHPKLAEGQSFALSTKWPERAAILDAEGNRLNAPGASGSVQMLTGTVDPVTAADLKRLGPAYRKGDVTGHGGIEQAYEQRLAGTPVIDVRITDRRGKTVAPVGHIAGKKGQPVRTSLDPAVQRAAAKAIVGQDKPTALVAVRPATGEVLAAANVPGGFNRAIHGHYPPGSTFKAITGAALLSDGLSPSATVSCPKTATVGGRSFRNFEHQAYGSVSFREAFARSCNTAFALQTKSRLSGEALTETAGRFGMNAPLNIGIPAEGGSFPKPRDEAELASAAFGQGRVISNPLHMATVAAAVSDGTWRPPALVREPEVTQRAEERKLDPKVTEQLRGLMRAVVTEGSAEGKGLPSGTAGKTGTAEYGGGAEPPTHAWFMGFRDDIAFAVVREDGKAGGAVAAPIGADFLNAL
ncbi:MAG: cell division protein FtsI [Streptosporangiales bacterium]|nr:cell division protein FtsI [Streptosporangiales bacterium]